MARLLIVIFTLAVAALAATAVLAGGVDRPAQDIGSADPTPEPAMPPFPERLAPPPTVYPPSQADEGAQVYYLVCMACHGDKGQGLTEEWRNVLSPEDRNCWQSKCHASNHPPEGFKMPDHVPPVVAPGLISAFGDAANLHNYLVARMPWQAPGRLSEQEYWQLTAFLIRENGIDLGTTTLGEDNAKLFSLRPVPTPTSGPVGFSFSGGSAALSLAWIGIPLLVGLVLGGLWLRRTKEVKKRS